MAALNLDKIKATLERAPEEFKDLVAQVGFPSGKNYPDGTSIAQVAAQNEFGAPAKRIPARPFMQPTIQEQKETWSKQIAGGVKQVVLGKMTAFDVLFSVGDLAANDMKAKIADIYSPPLSPYTLAKRLEKGNTSTKPLIDTSTMLSYLQHGVAKEGSEFTSKE